MTDLVRRLFVRLATWTQHELWVMVNEEPEEIELIDEERAEEIADRVADTIVFSIALLLFATMLLAVKFVAWVGDGVRSTAWVIKQRLTA